MLSTQLWHHLDDSPLHTTTRWLPAPTKQWMLPTCHNNHWALIVIDHEEKTVTQMDSLHFDIKRAERVRDYLVKVGYDNYSIKFKQPIEQNDGNSCGIHMLDCAQQLAYTGKVKGKQLTRDKFLSQFQMVIQKYVRWHTRCTPLDQRCR